MIYHFSIPERLHLTNLLLSIREGKFEELIAKNALEKEITFTEEEIIELNLKTVQNEGVTSITWDVEKATTKEITITELGKAVLVSLFARLDEQGKGVSDLIPLYLALKEEPTT